jgi:hypothetical protein
VHATALTPDKLAALEAAAAEQETEADAVLESMLETSAPRARAGQPVLDESTSPVAGRRFNRG